METFWYQWPGQGVEAPMTAVDRDPSGSSRFGRCPVCDGVQILTPKRRVVATHLHAGAKCSGSGMSPTDNDIRVTTAPDAVGTTRRTHVPPVQEPPLDGSPETARTTE